MLKTALLAAAGLIAAASPEPASSLAPPSAGEQVVDLPFGGGLTQRVIYSSPPQPRATLVMLPGGSGDLGLQPDGSLRHADNFVVRSRAEWVARGYAVVIPDTVDRANLRGTRQSPAYGDLVDDLAGFAHDRDPAPVFLLGTSQGTIAAMNGAAHARHGLIAGVILSEPVSVPGRLSSATVFDADPGAVRVPALVVANRDDRCDVAPPAMASRVAAAMTHSPHVQVLLVSGGVQQSARACGSRSPHGYDGIETHVIDAIVHWLRDHGG